MFYVFTRAVSPDVCDQIVKDCKKNVLKEGAVGSLVPNIRKNLVCFIQEKEDRINALAWHFLRKANNKQFNYDLKYFESSQFSEYKDGGFYGWHKDSSDERNKEIRKLSLTLALSNPDTFEGGDLQFYSGDRPMEDMGEITAEQITNDIKAQGSVVVFDSRDWHRVTPVTKGVRHSIVCWTVGPNFK